MYEWGQRLITLAVLLLAGSPVTAAQSRTADIGATIFTDASPTALIHSRPLKTLLAEGYTHEAVLTQDVRILHMLIYDPVTKEEHWVSDTKDGQPLILSTGTRVLLKRTNEKVDFADFIVFSVPGNNEQQVPGCGNKCRGVSIQDRIEVSTSTTPLQTNPPLPLQPNPPLLTPPREQKKSTMQE
ncbi:MAG: hypothetical protein KBD66_04020 [Candidatus Doudnabacteria bacterium]|nr:hypothetical protein [Candidatus Doudnabacteria bacterium]